MTPELAAQIRAFAADCPHMNQVQIGGVFGVNPGRVSEAIHHLR